MPDFLWRDSGIHKLGKLDRLSDPDHLDVLKPSLLENERLQPAHHAVLAVEKVGL